MNNIKDGELEEGEENEEDNKKGHLHLKLNDILVDSNFKIIY